MKIQIVGPGCPRCNETERNAINACAALDLAADITHVHDIKQFASLGVMATPSVVLDGKVVIAGRVPSVEELKKLFSGRS
jgi:small redox-active disulfide protein 2